METSGYAIGIPTYTDPDGKRYGMLCETKEKCISDDSGVTLDTKLVEMQRQISEAAADKDASTLEGHGAEYFATSESVTNIINGTQKVGDAEKLDGKDSSHFATAESVANIVNGATAVGNAEKLDGQGIAYFATATSVTNITNGTTKVGNADKLDGQDSTYFATADSVTNIVNGTTQVGNAQKLGGNTADAFAKKTDLTKYMPAVVVATDPGAGASTSYANGTLIFVKE